jgi:hypothetical protein
MADLSTTLPAGLNNPEGLAKVRMAVKQWSQLVAWSWSPSLAFGATDSDPGDPQKAEDEQKLKDYFKSTLSSQAKYLSAATSYGDRDASDTALATAENIKKLFAGDNKDIKLLATIQLTLPEVLKKLTGDDFIFGMDADFRKKFRFEVIVDEFSGRIRIDEEEITTYVASLTYPPRPSLGKEFDDQLKDWMNGIGDGDYLPPSAYIPLSGT